MIVLAAFSLAGAAAARNGAQICATCHPAQAKPQPATSMAHALELVSDCTILREHPLLTTTLGKYSYRIERKGDQSIYSVSDGTQILSAPISWAFGLGAAGQTYVFEKDGSFYQSRVSYYREINGLDLTMGASNIKPANLMDAAGQLMDHGEKVACFGCHATNAIHARELTLDTMRPGVECERCHGPAESHLEGIRRGDAKLAQMKDLKALSTEQISNFCGQCHRTWEQIASAGTLGIANIRFQPYRLTNSKCYDTEDARISCTACHDPHREVDRVDSHYDAKCLACHGGGKPQARACKVSAQNCVTCHMPKLELPGSHNKFTDHMIRIARANERYPN
jgi:hypothetical protein